MPPEPWWQSGGQAPKISAWPGAPIPNPVFGAFMPACEFIYRRWSKSIADTGKPQVLSGRQREILVKEFGEDFVNRVQLRYEADMQYFGVGGIVLGGLKNIGAQTFGRNVYVRDAYQPDNDWQLALLAHEFVHVRQFEEGNFSGRYCRALFDGKMDYYRNAMELEAYAFARQFACKHKLSVGCR